MLYHVAVLPSGLWQPIELERQQKHLKQINFISMNKREQELVAAFFEEIYEAEEVLDFIKQQLASSPNFNPRLLFQQISAGDHQITVQRMRNYLEDRVAANERELYEIFERFDSTRQGFISTNDFLNEIAPFARKIETAAGKDAPVSSEVEGHFISLLVEILKRLRILEVTRKQVRGIAPYDAFAEIDQLRTGALGTGALRRFLQANDFNVTDRQLYYLLHGLRRRCYRDVNLEVFCENLDPLEFGHYTAYHAQLEGEREQDFLRRSRHEEESMRRSRVEAQRVEHELQKAERKRQAELERQLELEDRVTAEMLAQEAEQERQVRRALLQEDKSIRHHLAAGEDVLRHEHIRNIQQRRENQFLNSRRLLEEERNAALANSALKREEELERSRRALERERQLLYREEIEKERQVARQAALDRELEQSKRRIFEESRRRYEEQAQQRIESESRKRYDEELARKKYEEDVLRQRYEYEDLLRRRYEDDLLPQRKEDRSYQQIIENSRRTAEESRRREADHRREADLRLEVESRRVGERQQESGKKPYVESQKSRYERELELEKLRAREDLHARLSNNKASEYEKELERTRYDIQRSRFGESRGSPGSYK